MTVAQIIAQVARERGLTPADLKGRSLNPQVCDARREAYALARDLTGQTWRQIARTFGRDHRAVMRGAARRREA